MKKPTFKFTYFSILATLLPACKGILAEAEDGRLHLDATTSDGVVDFNGAVVGAVDAVIERDAEQATNQITQAAVQVMNNEPGIFGRSYTATRNVIAIPVTAARDTVVYLGGLGAAGVRGAVHHTLSIPSYTLRVADALTPRIVRPGWIASKYRECMAGAGAQAAIEDAIPEQGSRPNIIVWRPMHEDIEKLQDEVEQEAAEQFETFIAAGPEKKNPIDYIVETLAPDNEQWDEHRILCAIRTLEHVSLRNEQPLTQLLDDSNAIDKLMSEYNKHPCDTHFTLRDFRFIDEKTNLKASTKTFCTRLFLLSQWMATPADWDFNIFPHGDMMGIRVFGGGASNGVAVPIITAFAFDEKKLEDLWSAEKRNFAAARYDHRPQMRFEHAVRQLEHIATSSGKPVSELLGEDHVYNNFQSLSSEESQSSSALQALRQCFIDYGSESEHDQSQKTVPAFIAVISNVLGNIHQNKPFSPDDEVCRRCGLLWRQPLESQTCHRCGLPTKNAPEMKGVDAVVRGYSLLKTSLYERNYLLLEWIAQHSDRAVLDRAQDFLDAFYTTGFWDATKTMKYSDADRASRNKILEDLKLLSMEKFFPGERA